MVLSIDLIQSISLVLILILCFLGFKLMESKWSYNISKPYAWEAAVKSGNVSERLQKIERTYRDRVRFYTMWFQVERLRNNNITGAFGELGVYKGETARILHEMDCTRKLYLFDTFEGFKSEDLLMESSADEKFSTKNFSDTSIDAVKKFIAGNSNLIFKPGYFPESAQDISEEKFAFVHLDADLYKPSLAALQFFYPRLVPGGVMLIHDYNHTWNGLRTAVDEFLPTIPESPVELPDWQGSILIIKNK
jgi:O-methyltransferase